MPKVEGVSAVTTAVLERIAPTTTVALCNTVTVRFTADSKQSAIFVRPGHVGAFCSVQSELQDLLASETATAVAKQSSLAHRSHRLEPSCSTAYGRCTSVDDAEWDDVSVYNPFLCVPLLSFAKLSR